jgi:4-diphosphocytidyl-2-C-methyl-D-erythritol kinase
VRSLPLRALAPAKINLALFLGPLTDGGRHELVSVMQSISLADVLTLDSDFAATARSGAARRHGLPRDEVVCPGVPGAASENLAATALAAFRGATGWDAPPLRLEIVKRVPVAAGLGGGSGDAAAALRLAAKASGREEQPLLDVALSLGSDVPAQIRPGRWLVSGTGGRLQELPVPRPPFGALVLPLDASLASADVYREADRLGLGRASTELARHHRALAEVLGSGTPVPPAELLVNDLEGAARSLCPAIDGRLQTARDAGADVALVSGSGPTVVGLFVGDDGVAQARQAADRLASGSPVSGALGAIASAPVQAEFASPVQVELAAPVQAEFSAPVQAEFEAPARPGGEV